MGSGKGWEEGAKEGKGKGGKMEGKGKRGGGTCSKAYTYSPLFSCYYYRVLECYALKCSYVRKFFFVRKFCDFAYVVFTIDS